MISGVSISVKLERNKDEILITCVDETNNEKYRIRIENLELVIKRWVVDKRVHDAIESKLKSGSNIAMVYNRLSYKE